MRTIAISKLKKLNQKKFEKTIFAKGDLVVTKHGKPLVVIISIKKFKGYMEIIGGIRKWIREYYH